MNAPIQRLRRLISRSADAVRAINEEELRYAQCVQEWNTNFHCDDWCDSDRAIECKQYIDWFTETRQ